MKTYPTFETQRLILKPITEADADLILALMNTPKWLRFIGDRNVHSLADAKTYIRTKMLPHLVAHGYGNYKAIRKADGAKIGTCGLYNREGVEGVDIGFAFLPEYEGMGFGLEAAQQIMQAAFQDFGLQKLFGYCDKENVASQRLLAKLGFTPAGTTQFPNDDKELLAFTLDAP